MKKILGLVAVAAIALFAVSCSGGGPGAVVEKAYNDMINGDYKAFVDAIYFADSIQGSDLETAKNMSVQMLEKTMKGIKEGTDEEAKKKLPKSVKILNEDVKDAEATVEVEVTSEGGEVTKNTIGMKKDASGAWKIADQGSIMPSATPASGEGMDLSGLDEAADSTATEATAEEAPAEETAAEETATEE